MNGEWSVIATDHWQRISVNLIFDGKALVCQGGNGWYSFTGRSLRTSLADCQIPPTWIWQPKPGEMGDEHEVLSAWSYIFRYLHMRNRRFLSATDSSAVCESCFSQEKNPGKLLAGYFNLSEIHFQRIISAMSILKFVFSEYFYFYLLLYSPFANNDYLSVNFRGNDVMDIPQTTHFFL